MFCTNCGQWLPEGSTICIYCGEQVGSEARDRACGAMPPDRYYYNPFYTDAGYTVARRRRSSRKTSNILIGSGIGVIIILLCFAMMLMLQNDDMNVSADDSNKLDLPSTIEYVLNYTKSVDENHRNIGKHKEVVHYSCSTTGLYDIDAPMTIPYSSDYYLNESDVYGLSNDEIQKAINDIYAKNGLIFETKQIRRYYEAQSWYVPWTKKDGDVWDAMSDIEQENIVFLKAHKR